MVHRCASQADTSAVGAINRPLLWDSLGEFHHWTALSASLFEETDGVTLHGFCSLAGGRSHSDIEAGCMVSWTTLTRCCLKLAKSTSLRRVALNASNVRVASYLRR